jgi:hypothetical protein
VPVRVFRPLDFDGRSDLWQELIGIAKGFEKISRHPVDNGGNDDNIPPPRSDNRTEKRTVMNTKVVVSV